jgi:hypothetical protein
MNAGLRGHQFVKEGAEEVLQRRDLIFPRKRVEGLFGYSGLWFRGDSKSSGDL